MTKKVKKEKEQKKIDIVEKEVIKKSNMVNLTNEEKLPDVQQGSIDAVNAKKAEETASENANIENDIKLNKDGSVAKKRGRKSKLAVLEKEKEKELINNQQSIETAQLVSGMIEQASVKLISPAWELTEIERLANIQAWNNTFNHYGGVAISPPQQLFLSHMSIILVRSREKETASKFNLFKAFIKYKILRRKKEDIKEVEKEDIKKG